MRSFAGSCRYVYNQVLSLQQEVYEKHGTHFSYAELCKLLTQWRHNPDTIWLKESPIHPLQQKLKDLDRSYSNFFSKRASFPRFKKKGIGDSFRYPYPKQIHLDQGNNRIFLPKLGWVRYRNSRAVLGTVKNVTVSVHAGNWFMSIQTARQVASPILVSGTSVGLDVGIVRFATLSDKTYYEPLHSFKRHETSLIKAQRSMSRKKKGSNNWKKAKRRIGKIHNRIGYVRKDYLHKLSTTISKNHAVVYVEDLKIKNMSASASGTLTEPGKNVRAKSGLNRSILDQGWYEFRRQLDYKLSWMGGRLIAVPPKNTSRTCPNCGYVSGENRPTQAKFHCVQCAFEEHADVVGAINILRAGQACSACEVNYTSSQQQEPPISQAIA